MTTTNLTAAQLNGILGIADDAIICVDETQKITLFNFGAERIFGWRAEDAIGQELNLLIPTRFRREHDHHVDRFNKLGLKARPMEQRPEIFGVRKNGVEFPAEASIMKLDVDGHQLHTVILRDISTRKAYENELRAAKETAEAAMHAKSMFLSNVSHEIRTPLNAVIGMTSLLLNTGINDEQRDYAETIRASSEVLLTTINDILDYSKIEIGRLEIEQHPFDLRRCVEESLDLLASHAADKQLNLAYFIDDSVPASLIGDVTRLRQILVNLLSNSIKFTQQGEVVVSVSAMPVDDGRYEIQFAVKDTGIGIPEDSLANLFQSFMQVDASITRKYGGTGLGLAISKRLTEIMGGRMWVDSEVGRGSTFFFTIVGAASGSQLANSFLQERSSALSGKRVLIVDDNATNRRILVKQALLWGMQPSAAASPIEALDFIRHGQCFDVGLLDMRMPEMDGNALALEIRKFHDAQALPLIMLTSVTNRRRDIQTSQVGFCAFLTKPIKPSALFDALLQSMQIAAPQGAQRRTVAPQGRLADSLPLKILVAEDNTVNQKVVQQLLAHLGYRADVVANGVEALDAMERQNYDVVLMDVQMPEMDGLEATRRLHARFGHDKAPRVIAMTANAMPGDREKCMAAGMNAYVSKPVELDDVRAILISVTGGDAQGATAVIDQRRIDQLLELQDENNPRLLSDLIELFCKDSPKHLERLSQAIFGTDVALMESTAHRFLSSIENFGADRMAMHCRELERLARAGTLDGAQAQRDSLQREFETARQHLLSLVPSA